MHNKPTFEFEFVALMASLMSIVALSIDALLPALPDIGNALGVVNSNDNQMLITMIFLGLGFGQLIFGPLSDSFGRKPIVFIGFLIFVAATIVCVSSNSFEVMIAGRILQGIGLASPRTLSIAMIRDSYSGDFMAKILSIVVMVFILVPVIAPSLGQFLLHYYNWKSIFYVNLLFGVIIIVWFWKRQEETLEHANRIKFTPSLFLDGTKEFWKHKNAVAFTLISGFIMGSFMVYLSTAQQIFQVQYKLADKFPYIFASLAIAVGLATFLNSRYVIRFGMWRIAYAGTIAFCFISLLYVALFWSRDNPSIEILITFFALQFFAIGFLFGNLRSLAMQPLGHIAGIGAAINGFISTVMAVPIANYIGSFVSNSVLPLFIGFSVFGILSLLIFMRLKLSKG
ncbi:multidrug effflux MFS transporter [Flavobacteriaceae bacterium]|jgi:DHA1 family bicyclomycin/chloramphenicol resistance-like MFS transporter|nr:multidrug effflux MFS transporter [Bacteroidota bacterium]MDB2471533.1 multidrug effflux MFS transporter [Flavobacteriaceae bacterium]MDC0957381.1 multidrug effflux MFS transporter [Flavobacteriaceae bacterium]MDC1051763.1 multidrug effflux MFS transporter [Flavobacteriaceae bacterium]MDC3242164.1 multidrug effflux MFS transporter [Flavobacteriaceae bacterium]|tara:strand:+ start:7483 stop:8676 length:1194 start_codon:yes stop_codon:yes gene_type:complete